MKSDVNACAHTYAESFSQSRPLYRPGAWHTVVYSGVRGKYLENRYNGTSTPPKDLPSELVENSAHGSYRWFDTSRRYVSPEFTEGPATKAYMEDLDRQYLREIAEKNPALFLDEMTERRLLSAEKQTAKLGLDLSLPHHQNLQREFAADVARIQAARGVMAIGGGGGSASVGAGAGGVPAAIDESYMFLMCPVPRAVGKKTNRNTMVYTITVGLSVTRKMDPESLYWPSHDRPACPSEPCHKLSEELRKSLRAARFNPSILGKILPLWVEIHDASYDVKLEDLGKDFYLKLQLSHRLEGHRRNSILTYSKPRGDMNIILFERLSEAYYDAERKKDTKGAKRAVGGGEAEMLRLRVRALEVELELEKVRYARESSRRHSDVYSEGVSAKRPDEADASRRDAVDSRVIDRPERDKELQRKQLELNPSIFRAKTCHFFSTRGSCRNGEHCTFRHDSSSVKRVDMSEPTDEAVSADAVSDVATDLQAQLEAFFSRWEGTSDPDLAAAKRASKAEFMSGFSYAAFVDKVTENGFTLHDTPNDGNCFFHAMLHQLQTRHPEIIAAVAAVTGAGAAEVDHRVLRQLAMGALRCGMASGRIDEAFTSQMTSYLATHSQDRTWADGPIMQALANVLGVTIVLINSREGNETILHEGDRGTLYLAYQENVHFQSTRGEPSEALRKRRMAMAHGVAPQHTSLEDAWAARTTPLRSAAVGFCVG